MRIASALYVFMLGIAGPALAQDPPARLQPGDQAPKLQVAEWVKGDPIARLEKGKVYLVEYWALWCGACIANIPHLNELQKKHARDGLVVIGMTNPNFDAKGGPGAEANSLQRVRDFVASKGERINYRIAYDTPGSDTYKSMMGERRGIPYAFLFGRDGRLLIACHPFFLESAIEKALAGTWDPVGGKAEVERNHQVFRAMEAARTYAEFQQHFSVLEKEFPAMSRRMMYRKFAWALKAGQVEQAIHAGEQMVAYARDTGDAKDLASIALDTAREFVALKTSSFGALLPDGQSLALAAVLRSMADAAAELSESEAEYRPMAAQAELAFQAGDFGRAVELQAQVMQRVPLYAKDNEKRRARAYARAVEDLERRRQAEEATRSEGR